MALMWLVLLASARLANAIPSTPVGHQNLISSSPNEQITPLVPISLGPVEYNDTTRINNDCKVPRRGDGWHQVQSGLWFQATGSLEVEDDKYTMLSNRLQCNTDSLSCTLTVSSVVSFTASETWGFSSSTSVGLGVKIEEVLTVQASVTEGSSHSQTSSTTTSSETSYSCTIPGNHTVYLAARVQYYLIFGYVSEWMIVRREFYIDGNGNIRERDYWGWHESCEPMFRIPKVQYDQSVAGTRRCVVEAYNQSANSSIIKTHPETPIATIIP